MDGEVWEHAEHAAHRLLERHRGLLLPLVFVSIIVLRKAERRVNVHARVWNKRLQHEIARWS